MYGEIISKADSNEEVVYAEIDMDKLNETRANLPYLKQKRNDLYEVKQF
jgi:omega-amidase